MPRQNRQRPVHLLRQHHPRQLVRQRHPSQGQKKISPLPGAGRPPIGRPNRKHQPLDPIIPHSPDPFGKLLRTQLPSTAVQQNQISRRPARLSVQPLKQPPLRLEHPRLRQNIAAGSLHVIKMESICGL